MLTTKKKYPIINIEGPDCGGKSTVLALLMDKVNHSFLLHTSAPVKGSPKEYYETVLNKSIELIELLEQPIFLDRFHIGEAVYGKIFRNYDIDIKDMDARLHKMGMKTIYVTANSETLIQRFRDRGDWHVKEEDLEVITTMYERRLQDSNLPLFVLDTSRNISDSDIQDLLAFINT